MAVFAARSQRHNMKIMDRVVETNINNWFWRYHFTWLTVLIAVGVSELGTTWWGWRPSGLLMYVVLSLSITLSGFRSALAGAIITGLYAFYHYETYGLSGITLITIGALAIAVGGGYLKNRDRRQQRQIERLKVIDEINQHKINFVDDLNGNIKASKTINELLIDLITKARYLTKDEIITQLTIVQDMAADLAQRALGWHRLYEEKKALIENNGDDK